MSNSKETVMQFGEGGFLRGFVDYFFHKLQEKGLYDGKIVVVQPIEKGMCQMLADQNCEYNLFLRGIDNGQVVNEHTHVTSISRALNPYTQYEEYMKLSENPDLSVILSNTTEDGIEYLGTEKLTGERERLLQHAGRQNRDWLSERRGGGADQTDWLYRQPD